MAKKSVVVCDNCGAEVSGSEGAVVRVNYNDARKGSRLGDLCDDCAGAIAGKPVARRGRPPKEAPIAA